jgi:hypothetical protein
VVTCVSRFQCCVAYASVCATTAAAVIAAGPVAFAAAAAATATAVVQRSVIAVFSSAVDLCFAYCHCRVEAQQRPSICSIELLLAPTAVMLAAALAEH